MYKCMYVQIYVCSTSEILWSCQIYGEGLENLSNFKFSQDSSSPSHFTREGRMEGRTKGEKKEKRGGGGGEKIRGEGGRGKRNWNWEESVCVVSACVWDRVSLGSNHTINIISHMTPALLSSQLTLHRLDTG